MTWEEAVRKLRQDPAQAKLVEDCYFDDPPLRAAKRFYSSSEWNATRSLLPASAGGQALDVGAGRGVSSVALAWEGWSTTAVEPDPSDLVGAGAIRHLANAAGVVIRVIERTGEELPFDNSSFDLVYCRQVLHHAHDLIQLCREVSRVLRPGGYFLAVREHVITHKDDLKVFWAQHPLHRLYGGENAYLLREYISAIQTDGMHLHRVLNPFESDLNLFPETRASLKHRLARKAFWPWPRLIPNWALSVLGRFSGAPGRLYSFASCKGRGTSRVSAN